MKVEMESGRGPEADYGDYARFMAFFTAHYLDCKARYDPLSVFIPNKIDLIPYQLYDFAALIEEGMSTGSIRALIAYETGLGKTILIGMLIKELLERSGAQRRAWTHDGMQARRVLIVVPPSVLPQFRSEMKDKFGLEFHQPDGPSSPPPDLAIASMDTIKMQAWKDWVSSQSWDLVVVDEYHRVSPYNMRGKLIELLSRTTRHFIALTATPHDGSSEKYNFRLVTIAPKPLVIRRTKREGFDINNRPIFDQVVEERVEEPRPTEEEMDFYRMAERYVRNRYRARGGGLLATLVGRAISSSIRSGLRMLKRRRDKIVLNELEGMTGEEAEEFEERIRDGGELTQQEIERILSTAASPEELEEELNELHPLIKRGEELVARRPVDSKGERLYELVKSLVVANTVKSTDMGADADRGGGDPCNTPNGPFSGAQRKVIIFTSFRETVEYLKEMLKEFGPLEITGEIDMEERKRTVDRFASDPSNRVLIGTDAMGESLNLQAASVEVNYEVPWSPVAYIQRVGRIWRLKQEHKHLLIINFLPPFPVEKRVMEVMLEKIRRINEEFGEIGLSVFGRELGTVDGIIKEAYTGTSVSADATASVDAGEGPEKGVVRAEEMIERAFLESQKIGREVVEVLNSSMALPRLVNVESLQMRKVLDLSDIATEEDLKRLLRYLKDAGVGYGEFPESYHVMLGNEYVRVDSLSFESGGMQAAIAAGKSVLPPPNRVRFNYVKDMVGWLMRAVVEVGGRTVYEEPVLFTLDGVLNYRGVLSLAPDFTCKITAPHFVPLDEYRSRAAARWLEREHALWEGEKKRLMREYEFEDNDIKKNAISRSLSEWLSKEPKESSVSVEFVPLRRECTGIGVGEGPSVEFVGFSPEEWRVRLEVEMMAMKTALEYYTQKGYDVKDVSRENRGYDLECASPNDILRVEVKGLRGGTSPVLTQNERSAAAFYRDSFVLFVVKEDVSGKRHIFEVTDPIRNLDLKEVPRPFYEAHGFNRFLVEIRPPLLDA